MRNIYLLLKAQALQWFGINKALHAKDAGERRKILLFTVSMVLVGLMCAGMSAMYSLIMAQGLAGILYLLPAVMMAAACLLTFITTLCKASGLLFAFQDYDMIMSLPVKAGAVAASRLLALYGMNLAFSLLITLPAAVVYAVYAAPPALYYVTLVLTMPVIPLVPVVAAAIAGTFLAVIASRFKHKNAVTAVGVFLLLAVLALLPLTGGMAVHVDGMADVGTAVMMMLNRIYPLTGWYTGALCDGSMLDLCLFLLISLLLAALFCWAVGRWYRRINSLMGAVRTGTAYKKEDIRLAAPFAALCRREFRRYFSSAMVVMNAGIGMILLPLAAVACLFMGSGWLETELGIQGLEGRIADWLPFGVALFLSMTNITASSISLEGRHLWLIKSLPVPADRVLKSKAAMAFILELPIVLVSILLLDLAYRPGLPQVLLGLALPLAYMVFFILGGLFVNLLFPNLTWTNEVTVVKQSAAAFMSLIGGMLLVLLSGAAMIPFFDTPYLLWAQAGLLSLLAAADILLYHWICTAGSRRFIALQAE